MIGLIKKLTTQQILEENLAQKAPGKLSSAKVVLHNIRSLHNVGSVFRSSDAFGISEILISGYTPTPPRPEITKTAIGAEEFVKWTYWDNTSKLISTLKKDGYTIIGLEQTDNSVPLTKLDLKSYDKICLVMGKTMLLTLPN